MSVSAPAPTTASAPGTPSLPWPLPLPSSASASPTTSKIASPGRHSCRRSPHSSPCALQTSTSPTPGTPPDPLPRDFLRGYVAGAAERASCLARYPDRGRLYVVGGVSLSEPVPARIVLRTC